MGQIQPFTREPLDPETFVLAMIAYDNAVVDIASAPQVVRELLAQHIIRLLAEGERDPHVLHERALASAGIPA